MFMDMHTNFISFRLSFFPRIHCRIPLFSENVMRLEYIDGPHVYNISTRNDYCNSIRLFGAKLCSTKCSFLHILKMILIVHTLIKWLLSFHSKVTCIRNNIFLCIVLCVYLCHYLWQYL